MLVGLCIPSSRYRLERQLRPATWLEATFGAKFMTAGSVVVHAMGG
jgi:hypothetical protein